MGRSGQKSISLYNASPNRCKRCEQPILHKQESLCGLSDTKKKKFCDRSCSAVFSNATRKPLMLQRTMYFTCKGCNRVFERDRDEFGYLKRKGFCSGCWLKSKKRTALMPAKTKGDLFRSRKHYQSARNAIRRHAAQVYKQSGRPLICIVCGYDKHADVAHIKAVSTFSDDATIREINDIGNLVPLCPNHHWEFDNGHLPEWNAGALPVLISPVR